MKIYTKTGDHGKTGLFGGGRVDKDDAQVSVYGTIDELNATLGIALALGLPTPYPSFIQEVQSQLFVLGAELATSPGQEAKLKLPLISAAHAMRLEQRIDEMEAVLTPLKQFILPGGCQAAGNLHLARTVCRRAEREFVSLQKLRREALLAVPRAELGVYLNRLSDFLFVLARYSNHTQNISDVPWQP
jgi:cob(I)alamin adenosyltransferase